MMVVIGDSRAGPLGRSIGREGDDGAAALKSKFGVLAAAKVVAGYRLRSPFHTVEGSTVWLTGQARETIAEVAGADGGLRAGDGNVYSFAMGFRTAIVLRQEFWGRFSLLPEVEKKDFVSAAAFREMVLHDNEHVPELCPCADRERNRGLSSRRGCASPGDDRAAGRACRAGGTAWPSSGAMSGRCRQR